MHTRQDNCAIILSLIIEGNASLDYVSTASTFYKRRNVYVDMAESYRVSLNRELYIIRVRNKSLLTVRPKSIIETIVLGVLSY